MFDNTFAMIEYMNRLAKTNLDIGLFMLSNVYDMVEYKDWAKKNNIKLFGKEKEDELKSLLEDKENLLDSGVIILDSLGGI